LTSKSYWQTSFEKLIYTEIIIGSFYAFYFKGFGQFYQQSFEDTYPKVIHCKQYMTKTSTTEAKLFNGLVLPF